MVMKSTSLLVYKSTRRLHRFCTDFFRSLSQTLEEPLPNPPLKGRA